MRHIAIIIDGPDNTYRVQEATAPANRQSGTMHVVKTETCATVEEAVSVARYMVEVYGCSQIVDLTANGALPEYRV